MYTTPPLPDLQDRTARARQFERTSQARARDALTLRGGDRLLALSLASTYARAARNLFAGVAA